MQDSKLEKAKNVLDKATSLLMATRAEHELFLASIHTLYETAKEAETQKIELEQLKAKLK